MALSIDKAKSETRFFAIASVVLLAIVVADPSRVLSVFLGIPLAITACLLLFHGTTWVSLRLQGHHRKAFQMAIAIAVPVALSLYFIHRTPQITAAGVLGPMLSLWYLLPIAIIGSVSWALADLLDREHPFRGFLIAAAVLFVLCLFGYYGIYSECEGWGESCVSDINSEAAARNAQNGRIFTQYLVYVAIAYGAMLAKLKKRHT